MRGLSPKALNIGPRQVEQLPLPSPQYFQKHESSIKPLEGSNSWLSWVGRSISEEPNPAVIEHWLSIVEPIVLTWMETNK